MSSQLYQRRARITVATPTDAEGNYSDTVQTTLAINVDETVGDSLRVRFKIDKNDQKEPNTSEVELYNLSEDSRHRLEYKGLKVSVEAGYAGTGITRIFLGDSRTTDHVRDGKSDWITKIRLGDGERGFRWARHTKSYAAGVSALTIMQDLAEATGLGTGNLSDKVDYFSKIFYQGYTVHGPVQRSLDRLVRSLSLKWSIQDGQLQVLQPGEALQTQIPLISPSSGLIGSPEMGTPEKKGRPALVKFKSLLVPTAPGRKVHLKSLRYDADVLVKKCSFIGDTRGGEWFTEIHGIVLSNK